MCWTPPSSCLFFLEVIDLFSNLSHQDKWLNLWRHVALTCLIRTNKSSRLSTVKVIIEVSNPIKSIRLDRLYRCAYNPRRSWRHVSVSIVLCVSSFAKYRISFIMIGHSVCVWTKNQLRFTSPCQHQVPVVLHGSLNRITLAVLTWVTCRNGTWKIRSM